MPMNARAHTQHTHKAQTFQSARSEQCLAKGSLIKSSWRLNQNHRQNDELCKGCCHCGFSCCHALKEDHEGIMQYRRSFSELPKAAQDRDLLWIFSGSAEVLPIQEEASPKSSPKGPEKPAQLIAVMRLRLRLSKPHHPVTQRMLRHLPFARK